MEDICDILSEKIIKYLKWIWTDHDMKSWNYEIDDAAYNDCKL